MAGLGVCASLARHWRVEQLDADADRGLEVACGRHRVGRKAHPGGVFGAGEQADLQVFGEIGPDSEYAVRHAVRLEEDRPQRRALAARDAAGLHHGDEHLDQRCDRIGGAIDGALARGGLRGHEMLEHVVPPMRAGPAPHYCTAITNAESTKQIRKKCKMFGRASCLDIAS